MFVDAKLAKSMRGITKSPITPTAAGVIPNSSGEIGFAGRAVD
jgi:hypothetical protein